MLKLILKRYLNSRRFNYEPFDSLLCFKDRNEIYSYMNNFFLYKLPLQFVRHRNYFLKDHRGFGENAFHSMWYYIFEAFRPINCLEIGVYRGQSISLWSMLSRYFHLPKANVVGISPFDQSGDSVSTYKDIDYYSDTIKNFKNFNLSFTNLVKGKSSDPISVKTIKETEWDLIYIDGSHDYEDVSFDYNISKENLSSDGIIVFDDSSLYFDYQPQPGSFKGHEGPSLIASQMVTKEMDLILGVGHNNVFKK